MRLAAAALIAVFAASPALLQTARSRPLGIYLPEQLQASNYRTAWNAMLATQARVPVWLEGLVRTGDWVDMPFGAARVLSTSCE